jgi:hypothetical protein
MDRQRNKHRVTAKDWGHLGLMSLRKAEGVSLAKGVSLIDDSPQVGFEGSWQSKKALAVGTTRARRRFPFISVYLSIVKT